MLGAPNVLCELGPISRASALAGVEAKASIPAGSAVTFRFEVEAGGNYTLLVRHDGAGLTLDAATPAGAATIDAGSAGSFHAVPLPLAPGQYLITAAARGGQAVFVDWELMINSGVGQAAGGAPAAVLALPAPASVAAAACPSATTTGSIGGNVGEAMGTASGAAAPPTPAVAASPARYLVGGPMGRTAGDPAGATPVVAMTPALGKAPAESPMAELETALLIALQPGAGAERCGDADPAPGTTSWFAELTRGMTGEAPVATAGDSNPIPIDPAGLIGLSTAQVSAEPDAAQATLDPGVLLGAVAVTVASRQVIKRRRDGSLPALTDARTPRAIRARLDRSLDLT